MLPGNPGEAQVNPTQFGRNYEALAGVGKQIQNLGAAYLEKQSIAEESDAILKQNQEDLMTLNDQKEKLKQEYQTVNPDGSVTFDPRGAPEKNEQTGEITYPNSYAKRVAEVANQRLNAGLEAMPSDRARNRYRNITDGIVVQQMLNAQNFEREQTALHLYDNAEKLMNQGVDQVYRYPSLENYSTQLSVMNDYLDRNKDSLFTGDKAVEAQKKLAHDLTTNGLLRGYLEQDPATGLALLGFHKDGKPLSPEEIKAKGYQLSPSDITHNLDKHEVADWVNKFQGQIQEQNRIEVRQLTNKLADFKAAAANGDPSVTVGSVRGLVDRMDALGAFEKDPAAKVRVFADALGDAIAGRARKQISKLSNDQISAIAAGAPGGMDVEAQFNAEIAKMSREEGVNLYPQFAAADKADMKNKVQAAAKALLHERATDPARSIISSNDALKKQFSMAEGGLSASPGQNEQYFSAILAEQKNAGISKAKLLTNDMAKGLAAQISSSNAQMSSAAIDDLKMKAGKYFPQVMNQVVKDGNLPDYYAVAGYVDDKAAGAAIIEGLRNKKTFDSVLADHSMSYKKSDLMASVNSEFSEIEKAINGQGGSAENVKISSGLRSAILYDTANRVAHGADPGDAARQATDVIFRNKYELYNGAILPRDAAPGVKKNMEFIKTKDWAIFNTDKLYLPDAPGMVKPNANAGEQISAYREKASRLHTALADENAHKWTTTPDNSGATLNLVDKAGNPYPVRWKNGKKVQIDFASGMLREGD